MTSVKKTSVKWVRKNADYSYWRINHSSILAKKTMTLDSARKKAYAIEFIQKSLRVFEEQVGQVDMSIFINSTTELISKIPDNKSKDSIQVYEYFKMLAIHKNLLRKHYHIVAKRYYLSIFLPTSFGLGLMLVFFSSPFHFYFAATLVIGALSGFLLDWNARRNKKTI